MTPDRSFDRSRFDWYPTVTRNGVIYTAARVVNSDGSPRPALRVPLNVFTVHYGGAGQWLDQGDTHLELAAIERNHAIPQEKPNEYNSASDTDELTWEWAGRFRAAHSSGENETAWGHLAVLGLETPTEAQADRLIAGIRRARAQAVAAGYLTADHVVYPHRHMPGAQTSCPGPLYTNPHWWNRIIAPLTTPPITPPIVIPPIPTIPGVPDMFHPLAKPHRNSNTTPYGQRMPANKPIWCGLTGPVPQDAVAVAVNVAVINPAGPGWAAVWPGGPYPGTACVNFPAGGEHNGASVVGVANGGIMLQANVDAHFILDITGYWTA
jgi:hypothetical protein